MEIYGSEHSGASRPTARLVGCGLLVVIGYLGTLRASVAISFPAESIATEAIPSESLPSQSIPSDTAPAASIPAVTDTTTSRDLDAEGAPGDPDAPEREKADLGPQPVLLWDRVARPVLNVCRLATLYPQADTVGPTTINQSIPFHVDAQIVEVSVLQPKMLAGALHRPHGPPSSAT